MDAEIDIWIARAEASWLDRLYSHAAGLFQDTALPSHDHSHHMRVWNLGKLILRDLNSFNSACSYMLVEGVLIASFFHDLGMVYSSREDHGKLGSDLCSSWFTKTAAERPGNFQEILEAVELHDRKDVQIYASFTSKAPPEILGILSVADDLEALGTIGIYRYAEIYLERGIPLEKLGEKILENVRTRWENLSAGCRQCRSIIESHREQYEEITRFFEQYSLQVSDTEEAEKDFSAYLGVINYIRIRDLDKAALEREDRIVKDYFKKLAYELDRARL